MKNNTKEWIQYSSAVVMLISGIVLAFLCFFLNHYELTDSVLYYTAECISFFSIMVGAGVYLYRFATDTKANLKDYIDQIFGLKMPGGSDRSTQREQHTASERTAQKGESE